MENGLKKARLMRGFAVADLSRLSGVPRSSIEYYERGVMPSVEKALMLAWSLDMTVEEIWFPED